MKHLGHTYGGFISVISEQSVTIFEAIKKILKGGKKANGERSGHVKGSVESQHNILHDIIFYTFLIVAQG
jgi:hypothetical protein